MASGTLYIVAKTGSFLYSPRKTQTDYEDRNMVWVGHGGSWERPVWTIGRETQRQGSWRTRQPVQQNLRSSRTLESSQEQETTPVPG